MEREGLCLTELLLPTRERGSLPCFRLTHEPALYQAYHTVHYHVRMHGERGK